MLKTFCDEQFDIVIQAGQSNSEGTGFGDVEQPYIPNETVWYLNPDFTIGMAAEKVNGNFIQSNFSLSFADEYLRGGFLQEDRKLLILRAAVGGTSFSEHHWGLHDPLYLKMKQMIHTALELNEGNRLVALLWHQGENDAASNVSYETHYNNLLALVNDVKTVFQCPDLPFVAGDFAQDWKGGNLEICKPVIDAVRDVCAACGSGAFVDTYGLQSNDQKLGTGDTIHFCREALYALGQRYFNAFKGILSEKNGRAN